MRIALISDLHGNAVALRSVLQVLESRDIDQVICLGDVATLGPSPTEVLEILEEREIVCIEGNHDAFLLDEQLIHDYTEVPVVHEAVDWCREQLKASHFAFLKSFLPTLEIALNPEQRLLLYHGCPTSHMQDILPSHSDEELDGFLAGATAQIMAGGHTHNQMLRQHRGRWIVNPGSLGQPFKDIVSGMAPTIMPFAEYAIIHGDVHGGSVELCRQDFNLEAYLSILKASDNPIASFLIGQYQAHL